MKGWSCLQRSARGKSIYSRHQGTEPGKHLLAHRQLPSPRAGPSPIATMGYLEQGHRDTTRPSIWLKFSESQQPGSGRVDFVARRNFLILLWVNPGRC